ncbi:MAG: fumarylacetoacetate hydrolase family protein [Nitrospirota bacterium]|nr:MAG: fumarylacetoacetate hydrolase family protein [Nitrospirota bacterium]
MKLIRFGEPSKEKPGIILNNDEIYDVSSFGEDYHEQFFETCGLDRLRKWIELNGHQLKAINMPVRLGPPVCRPSKIVCIGFNYKDHARETGRELPAEPVFFLKATSALAGPNDDIILPRSSVKTDWEVELAVVVGKRASYISIDDAMRYVAGYALFNDYSEREFQFDRGGQWVKGKSADTFGPLGPFLVPAEDIPDCHDLNMWLNVNGEKMQDSNTSNMHFNVPALISSVSQYMTLLPGDIISTGTPAGVGHGMDPPRYLKRGDTVEYGIEGLGSATQRIL